MGASDLTPGPRGPCCCPTQPHIWNTAFLRLSKQGVVSNLSANGVDRHFGNISVPDIPLQTRGVGDVSGRGQGCGILGSSSFYSLFISQPFPGLPTPLCYVLSGMLESQQRIKQEQLLPLMTHSGASTSYFLSQELNVLICILGILILTQDCFESQLINKCKVLSIYVPNAHKYECDT